MGVMGQNWPLGREFIAPILCDELYMLIWCSCLAKTFGWLQNWQEIQV